MTLPFPPPRDPSTLSLLDKLRLWLHGCMPVGEHQKPGWKGPLTYYYFVCPDCGPAYDYKHGYRGRLDCPTCDYRFYVGYLG